MGDREFGSCLGFFVVCGWFIGDVVASECVVDGFEPSVGVVVFWVAPVVPEGLGGELVGVPMYYV